MALVKDTNSYVTLAEADAYFADRLDVAAWTSGPEAQKEQALVTATSILDDLRWTGIALSETQPLAFPRSGSYFDPRVGNNVVLGDTVPTRVIKATYELAYHLLNNDGLEDDTGSASSISVGSITINGIKPASKLSASVKRLVTPLLYNSGSNSWWRAN
jgi:hypothetical protein